jgi:hypothetical protein
VGDVSVEAVGGEEELVAGEDLEREGVDLDALVDADGPGDGVLLGDLFDLVAAQLPAFDELVEDGVVLGDLLDLAGAHQVDAAVADVGDVAVGACDEEGGEGGAHAALARVGLGLLVDARARPLHGELEEGEDLLAGPAARLGRVLLDDVALLLHLFVDDADGERARDLPGGVAAHAVGDDDERELLVDEEVVLVVIAQAADVGGGVKPDVFGQAHRARG